MCTKPRWRAPLAPSTCQVEAPFGRDFNDLPLDDLVDGMVASAMAASGDVSRPC